MIAMIAEFFIQMEPQPQERIRFHFKGFGRKRKILPYIPQKSREAQDLIRSLARQYMEEFDLPEFSKEHPLKLTAIFYLRKPKSVKRLWPTVRPDLSNYLKLLEDGLQRAVKDDSPALLEDDSAICSAYCEKRYCDDEHPTPGVLVRVEQWRPE